MLGLITPPLAAAALLALTAACGQSPGATGVPGNTTAAADFDADRAFEHLKAQVAIGPRMAGSPQAEATRAYIEEQLAGFGLESTREAFEADTPIGPVAMANVVATLPAARRPEDGPVVVLCAHYDTKRASFEFVGANDGASGVAVLIELARALSTRENPVTYRIVFLDGEEAMRWNWRDPDNRYGSRRHVELLKQDPALLARIKACVLLDLVGDADLQLTTDTFSDEALREAFFGAARAAGLGAHVDGTRMPVKDDHLSFMAAGIPCVDLIDLEYGPNNQYWHSPDDTLDKVSKESLDVIGRIVLLGLPTVEELVR